MLHYITMKATGRTTNKEATELKEGIVFFNAICLQMLQFCCQVGMQYGSNIERGREIDLKAIPLIRGIVTNHHTTSYLVYY